MLKELPFNSVVAPISLALIVIFFVTSSDYGSLVIDTITAGVQHIDRGPTKC